MVGRRPMGKRIGLLVLSVSALAVAPALGCRSRQAPVARETSGTARPLPPATHVEVPFLGPSPRQVLSPVGVAVGDGGEVYLLDGATGLVKEFSPRGEPVRKVRVAERRALAAEGWVSQCLAWDRGGLLVLDTKRATVRRFDAQGHPGIGIRVSADRSKPYYAIRMAPDAEGSVYVATGPDLMIRKYDTSGRATWERTLEASESTSPQLGAIAVDPQGRLWVWLSESPTVFILDRDGRLPARRGERRLGDRDEWGDMVAACFDGHGSRYELSFSTAAGYGTDVAKFDPQGRALWARNLVAVRGTGLAVDSAGRVLVTLQDYKFTAAACVVFSPEGKELGLIGSNGTRPGEVRDPSGVAVDADGSVYVGDYYTFRIQKFAPDGKFLGRIMGPTIAESPTQEITAEGPLDSPASVVVGPDGLIYVTHSFKQTISVYSRAGALVRSCPRLSLGYGGTTDYHFGASPRFPASIALDSEGHMWTAVRLEPKELSDPRWRGDLSTEAVRVAEYDRAGRELRSFGGFGDGPGAFGRRAEHLDVDGISDSLVAVGEDDTVWVVDRANNRVQQFDREGRFLGQIGPKVGDLTLDRPWGVAVGGPGHLYIGDDRAILEFTPDGAFVGVVAPLESDRPFGVYRYRALAVDASGSAYLSDGGMGAVREFVPRERGDGLAAHRAAR